MVDCRGSPERFKGQQRTWAIGRHHPHMPSFETTLSADRPVVERLKTYVAGVNGNFIHGVTNGYFRAFQVLAKKTAVEHQHTGQSLGRIIGARDSYDLAKFSGVRVGGKFAQKHQVEKLWQCRYPRLN